METVVARGVVRICADLIKNGTDVDTALREASRGATNQVRECVLYRIFAAIPRGKKATPEIIGAAILSAAKALDQGA